MNKVAIKVSLWIVAFLLILLLSCASLPTTPAPWDASPAAIRQVFPDEDFIAQRGRGATRAAAEAQAASELARFLSSQISASKGYQSTTSNAAETINTRDEAYVNTQINLFGIRYADDAYYRKDLKEWRTVAWIERAEAWAVYAPQFNRQADAFMALYSAAEKEDDQFKKYFRYISVENYVNTEAFVMAPCVFTQMIPKLILPLWEFMLYCLEQNKKRSTSRR